MILQKLFLTLINNWKYFIYKRRYIQFCIYKCQMCENYFFRLRERGKDKAKVTIHNYQFAYFMKTMSLQVGISVLHFKL